jgi:prepilin-type N-terminal cleavage/methylation domain-containing protein
MHKSFTSRFAQLLRANNKCKNNPVVLNEYEGLKSNSHRRGFFGLRPQNDDLYNNEKNLFTYSLSHLFTSKNKKAAFTLAEVLITLGIIGVVAAITLPVVVSNYRKSLIENQLKTTVSIISNAVRLSVVENGEPQTWNIGNSDNDTFNKYIVPYLKITKVCNLSEVADTNNKLCYTPTIKTIDGSGYITFRSNYKYLLSNGVAIIYIPGGTIGTTARRGTFEILLPTNRKDLLFGRDVFPINLVVRESANKYLITSVYDYPGFSSSFCPANNSNAISACKSGIWGSAGYSKAILCTAMIECNNWKIPSNYPYKF